MLYSTFTWFGLLYTIKLTKTSRQPPYVGSKIVFYFLNISLPSTTKKIKIKIVICIFFPPTLYMHKANKLIRIIWSCVANALVF